VTMDKRNALAFEGVFRLSKRKYLSSLLLLLLGLPLTGSATQTTDTVRLPDNSDWWSETRSPDSDEEIKTEKRELARTNFQVLGINLGETMFSRAATKFGKATTVERGDASTGRQQVCYASSGAQDKGHLIFEQGEVGYTSYLFADGPTWEGADRCFVSKAISRSLATASGLQLGMTPAQVIAILGKPTKRRENALSYSFLVRKKTSPKDLKEARERNPDMSEKDFQANYGYYDLGTGAVAKFVNSKLTYLGVSNVEST
jgi:hypothetical protein